MRRFFLHCLSLALLVFSASCSQDGDTTAPSVVREREATMGAGRSARPAGTLAALPDRGDLLGYPAQPVVRRDAASTWHQAGVSEEHALRAVLKGEMAVTPPGSTPVRLRYSRHVEHENGNWTWIGRNARGEEAIVTFGEKAVFGTIPGSDGTEFTLTTHGGRTWMVKVDPAKLHSPDPREPDYIVPPRLAASLASEPVTASAETTAASAATTETTIDLALGYTTGFAAELGGDSQAVTRLQHLVDVTNQAYANSQIAARLRLVKSMSVSYGDATDNNDALSKLTGYKSGTGSIQVDPAFTALRAARDEYGADLVSLVRRFRAPENKGCGIAWLIGGNQSGIDGTDARWGYSVASDDIDRGDLDESDGKTYACRKETLAHELGHNMGQAHNVEDSGGDSGAHAYSYGYRESSSSGFYTVMAYRLPDSSQRGIRYFANPNVVDPASGRPTGVATASDNARSMTQTMPLVAAFRATVIPNFSEGPALADGQLRDINNDGRADMLWVLGTRTHWAYWLMLGATKVGGVGYNVGANWRAIASGDFNGDGYLDLVWSNGSDMQLWKGSPSGFAGEAMRSYPAGWTIVGVGDVNADGRADLLWRDDASTVLSLWLMNGASIAGSAAYAVPAPWRVVGTGRFNADGRLDIIWTDGTSMQMWLGAAQGFTGAAMPAYPTEWNLQGIGDFNGDGMQDLIWRHPTVGQVAVWTMSGGTRTNGFGFNASPAWWPVSVGDYSGDGRVDLVWTDGQSMQMWLSTGTGFAGAAMSGYPTGWDPLHR